MSNQMQTTMQKIPGIGDIPILGYLFKSKAAKRDQTELVVMITPEILPNNSPGVTPSLPKYPDTFMPPLSDLQKSHPAPAPAFTEPSRSLAANPAAAPVVDNRTEIERAQDRALAAIDHQTPQPAAVASAAAPAAASPVVAAQAAAPVKAVAAPAPVNPAAAVAAQAQTVAVQPAAAQAPAAQTTDRPAWPGSRPTPMSPNCRRNSVSSRRPHANRPSVTRRLPTRRGRKKRSAPLQRRRSRTSSIASKPRRTRRPRRSRRRKTPKRAKAPGQAQRGAREGPGQAGCRSCACAG